MNINTYLAENPLLKNWLDFNFSKEWNSHQEKIEYMTIFRSEKLVIVEVMIIASQPTNHGLRHYYSNYSEVCDSPYVKKILIDFNRDLLRLVQLSDKAAYEIIEIKNS